MKYLVSLVLILTLFSPGGKFSQAAPAAQELPDNPVCTLLQSTTVTVETASGSGSGSIIVRGEDTFVLTAGHVVASLKKTTEDTDGKKKSTWEDAKVIQKVVQGGRIVQDLSYPAEVVRYSDSDNGEDLALLRLYSKGAFKASISFYLSDKIPPIGTSLLHSGSPLGDIGAGSIIPGFMSAHGRLLEKKVYDQISCSAYPGSSGGAICLLDGRWIGLVLRGKDGGFILIRPVRVVRKWAQRVGVEFILDSKLKVPTEEELKKKPVEEK